ncbi:MAG: capsid protein [Eubacteriales bacterium]|nr:capsid protein [Eubacteriales bacterium]
MRVGDKIRDMLRSFLQIEPATGQGFYIHTALDWQGNAAKNRMWYRGDAAELNEFYQQIPDQSTQCFWAAVPTRGLEIRKCHTGLPKEIIETLAGLIVADLNGVTFPTDSGGKAENLLKKDLWERIAKENEFRSLVTRALCGCMVIGDGAFKIIRNPDLSELPIIEWVDGDRVELVYHYGRIREIVFRNNYPKGYVLYEHFGFGYVRYELHQNGNKVDLSRLEETAALEDVTFDTSYMMAVPFKIRESNKWPGRGQSFFEGKTDAFDALDEAWSQWVHAMRTSRPRVYIPENLIPRDANNGALLKPNAFDCQHIAVERDASENAKNEITLQQAAFYAEQYNSTYITALDLALQGLISPSTLGIDTKKMDNAEAQREKEKTTLYTRQLIIDALTDTLRSLVGVVFKTINDADGQSLEDTEADVVFGEYANPSFEAVVETLSNPNTPMSIEAKVDELWGDSKDEDWKRAEVQRIREEQGLATLEEPAVSGAIGGMLDDSTNWGKALDDESQAVSGAVGAGQ